MLSFGYTAAEWFLLSKVLFLGISLENQVWEELVNVLVTEDQKTSPVSRDVGRWRKVVDEGGDKVFFLAG